MHGDAVHRRRHPVLAHPVTDDSGRRSRRGGRPSGPWPWCCSTGSDRPSRRPARERPLSGCRAPCPRLAASRSWRWPGGNRRTTWRWQRRDHAAARCADAAGIRRGAPAGGIAAAPPRRCRTAAPRAPAARHSARTSSGIDKGRVVPAEPLARRRRSPQRRAARRAPRRCRPWSARRRRSSSGRRSGSGGRSSGPAGWRRRPPRDHARRSARRPSHAPGTAITDHRKTQARSGRRSRSSCRPRARSAC